MKRALIPAGIIVLLTGILVLQLGTAGGTLCRVCVTYEGRRQCAESRADVQADAERDAQSSACSLIAHGVSDAMACPNVRPDSVECHE
jgi:hypothetical protein